MSDKQIILSNCKTKIYPEIKTGGQTCGVIPRGIEIENEDIGVKIIINSFNSLHKNRKLAFLLMELTIDEIVK